MKDRFKNFLDQLKSGMKIGDEQVKFISEIFKCIHEWMLFPIPPEIFCMETNTFQLMNNLLLGKDVQKKDISYKYGNLFIFDTIIDSNICDKDFIIGQVYI